MDEQARQDADTQKAEVSAAGKFLSYGLIAGGLGAWSAFAWGFTLGWVVAGVAAVFVFVGLIGVSVNGR